MVSKKKEEIFHFTDQFFSSVSVLCLLQTASAQAELQAQREQAARLQDEASAVRRSCEEKCSELTSFLDKYQEKSRELEEARMKLQAERLGSRWRTSPLRPSHAAPVKSQCFLNPSYRVLFFFHSTSAAGTR